MLTPYILCQKAVTCSLLITVKTVDGFHSWLTYLNSYAGFQLLFWNLKLIIMLHKEIIISGLNNQQMHFLRQWRKKKLGFV